MVKRMRLIIGEVGDKREWGGGMVRKQIFIVVVLGYDNSLSAGVVF